MSKDKPNYSKWIENHVECFKGSDKRLVKKFVRESLINTSEKTTLEYLCKLVNLRKMLRKNFSKWKKDDVKEFCFRLNKIRTGWTRYNYLVCIKKFFQIIKGFEWNSREYPKMVKWIKYNPNKIQKSYVILEKKDIEKFIESCSTLRDKAFLGLLWSSGCRIGEIWNLKVNDLVWDKYGLMVRVNGKTGFRTIRVTEYWQYLKKYLEERPYESQRVWIAEDNYWKGKPMSKKALWYMIKRVKKKTGITKPTNPHNFRHSIATRYAKLLTDQEMRIQFGWSRSSKMPSFYSHLSCRDVDEKLVDIFYNHKGFKEHEPESKVDDIAM